MDDMMTVVETYEDGSALLVCPECGRFSKHKIVPVSSDDKDTSDYSVWAIDEPEYHCPLCWTPYNFCSDEHQSEWYDNYKTTIFYPEYDISMISDRDFAYVPVSFLTASLTRDHDIKLHVGSEDLHIAAAEIFIRRDRSLEETMSPSRIEDKKIYFKRLCLSSDAYITVKQMLETRYPELRNDTAMQSEELGE